ncbi:hypothetical protein KY285_010637 [Solanum tuberosum]|nr:hypothetical protein KY289_011186 [Solanum tuberosum]KAH0734930.1 hypothetical protein KY285_010637 [Solanum tuberosum]
MLHGLEYTAPASVGLFEGKHHEVTSDTTMEIQDSRERVLRWIAKQIAIDGENVVWVTTTPTLITKASLSFPAKVWWVVVRVQLRPTANDNALSPSLDSLVACIMVGYPMNVGLIDRWGEEARLIQVSKIKDVANHLFGAKSGVVGTLSIVLHVPLDIPQANKWPEQGESSQPSTEAPPPPASASQALVPNQENIQPDCKSNASANIERCVAGVVDTEEFKSQLAKMRTHVAKLHPPLNQLTIFGVNYPRVSSARGITEPKNMVRGYLLTSPERNEGKKTNPAKHQGRQLEKKKHLNNNREMQCSLALLVAEHQTR